MVSPSWWPRAVPQGSKTHLRPDWSRARRRLRKGSRVQPRPLVRLGWSATAARPLEVVADVQLAAAEEGVPVEVLLGVAAPQVPCRPQVRARLRAGVEQRQALRAEHPVRGPRRDALRPAAGDRE